MQNQATSSQATLAASYFDGRSARAQAVVLRLDAGVLHLSGEGVERQVALADVQWPERQRHGLRVAHFRDGGSVQSGDAAAWDAWSRSQGRRDSLVVRMQQSWRLVFACMAALVLIGVAIHQWGLPLLSRAVVAAAPLSVDRALGEASLSTIDNTLMRPSRLPPAEQQRLRAALARALEAMPAGTVPEWQLVFRKSRIGPNAFALPGGTLVMTDELVELVGADDKVVTAVLAHEIGHVRHRHGLRMLVEATVLGGLSSLVLGDFSTVLAGVPVLLGQASYSREAEREADAEAVTVLRAAGISPLAMVTLFDKLADKRRADSARPAGQGGAATADEVEQPASWLGIAFASHPEDAERIRFFRDAAAR